MLAELTKCDVCGQVGVPEKAFSYSMYSATEDESIDSADLCPVCKTEIVRYVRELKKRAKKAVQ